MIRIPSRNDGSTYVQDKNLVKEGHLLPVTRAGVARNVGGISSLTNNLSNTHLFGKNNFLSLTKVEKRHCFG